jgi:ribosome-associated toxin RatA of RatAB toxin-antitoxin module
MTSTSRSIDIDVPATDFMAVICDFDRYPLFLSAVTDARVEEVLADSWRVAFEVIVLRRRIGYRLEFIKESPLRLAWGLVDGEWMTANEGSWDLQELDAQTTRATYAIAVALAGPLPSAVTSLLIDGSIPRLLREFKRRAESLVGRTVLY